MRATDAGGCSSLRRYRGSCAGLRRTVAVRQQTITLIERARRQERRLQRAYRRMRNRQDSIDLASAGTKFAPPEWVAAETQFSD